MSIQYWNGDNPATFSSTCPSTADNGLQKITIKAARRTTGAATQPLTDPQEATVKSSGVRCRARTGREHGLSLIELLIAISITGIIMGPIGFAIYFGLRSTADTQTRLIESNKANVFASYFAPDVQNAVTVGTNVSESAAACGTPLGTPVGAAADNRRRRNQLGLLLPGHRRQPAQALPTDLFGRRGDGDAPGDREPRPDPAFRVPDAFVHVQRAARNVVQPAELAAGAGESHPVEHGWEAVLSDHSPGDEKDSS